MYYRFRSLSPRSSRYISLLNSKLYFDKLIRYFYYLKQQYSNVVALDFNRPLTCYIKIKLSYGFIQMNNGSILSYNFDKINRYPILLEHSNSLRSRIISNLIININMKKKRIAITVLDGTFD